MSNEASQPKPEQIKPNKKKKPNQLILNPTNKGRLNAREAKCMRRQRVMTKCKKLTAQLSQVYISQKSVLLRWTS